MSIAISESCDSCRAIYNGHEPKNCLVYENTGRCKFIGKNPCKDCDNKPLLPHTCNAYLTHGKCRFITKSDIEYRTTFLCLMVERPDYPPMLIGELHNLGTPAKLIIQRGDKEIRRFDGDGVVFKVVKINKPEPVVEVVREVEYNI